ncbi:hypothetical protein [Georgenia sp. MJ170]|uniref:hypothetical protein n=1 Tax=Georgenia sunbinii TaxID=3117728 RepID=UPI002F261CF8
MLTLTSSAKAAITEITSESGLPESGGVRISMTSDNEQIEMALSPRPESGDEIIDDDGARVFVDGVASPVLAQHTLDAQNGPDGVGFALQRTTA